MEAEEVLIRPHWLTQKGITPVQFGLSFLFLVAVPLTLWSLYADQTMPFNVHNILYVSYLKNISWSLSLILIFPLFLGLSLHFYNTYPTTLQHLYYTTATEPDKEVFQNLCKKIENLVSNTKIPVAATCIAIIYTGYIYINQLSNFDVVSWMTSGTYLTSFSQGGDDGFVKGLTNRGVVAFFIQTMLTAWLLTFVIRSFYFIRGLFDLFNSRVTNVSLDPFHSDSVSGLSRLTQLATLQAMMFFLIGLYVSLKVVDRIYFQEISIFSGIGNTVAIASYVVIAPAVYFLTLGSAYNKMRDAKLRVLSVFDNKIKEIIDQLKIETDVSKGKQYLEYLQSLEERKISMKDTVLVLPFNVKSMQGIFSAVLTPLVAPLMICTVQLLQFLNKI